MQTSKIIFLTIIGCAFAVLPLDAAAPDYVFFENKANAPSGFSWQPTDTDFKLIAPAKALTEAIEIHVNIGSDTPDITRGLAYGSVYELSIMSDQKKFAGPLEFMVPVNSSDGHSWWLQTADKWQLAWGYKNEGDTLFALFKVSQPGQYNLVLASDIDQSFDLSKSTSLTYKTSLFSVKLPDTLTLGNNIELKHLSADSVKVPDSLVSPIYQYDLKGFNTAEVASKLVSVTLPYYLTSYYARDLVFLDKRLGVWRSVPSVNNLQEQTVTAKLPFTYAVVALVENKKVFDGIASWYAYKACDCAAARFLPKQSKVKVTNLANGQSRVVRINDYGPEEWTGRLIDLDSTVFKAISNLWRGLINVRVEPL